MIPAVVWLRSATLFQNIPGSDSGISSDLRQFPVGNLEAATLFFTELLRWEGTSEDHLVQPPGPEQGQLEQVSQGGVHSGFE